jgi:hypothetical protein
MSGYSARAAVFAVAMTMPVALHAQRGMGMGPGPGLNSVGTIIDMRRELNLTSRQLVRLDSIERTLFDRNKALRDQLRARLDTAPPRERVRGQAPTEEEIQRIRARGDSMRAVRRVIAGNDSVAREAAMAVLTDSQRIQVRERVAERRGFMMGRRARGGRGMQGPPESNDAMPRGRRGGMGMGADAPGARMRREGGGPPGDVGPRFYRRPPSDEQVNRES